MSEKLTTASVLAFERKLDPSDALFASGNWAQRDQASAWTANGGLCDSCNPAYVSLLQGQKLGSLFSVESCPMAELQKVFWHCVEQTKSRLARGLAD